MEGAKDKPPLLLLHELNGLTEETFRYAIELSKDFTVYIPLLFGEKGVESVVSGPWAYWIPGGEWGKSTEGIPPIVRWLREVVSIIHANHQAPLRIIGNCMTGALPLALLTRDEQIVNAVVVAQPALPLKFFWWYTDDDHKSLGLSNEALDAADNSRAKIFALRFETDWISDRKKLDALHYRFKERVIDGEICASYYQPQGVVVRAHSTLIGERDTLGKLGELSKAKRKEVRAFLLNPDVYMENSRCSSQ